MNTTEFVRYINEKQGMHIPTGFYGHVQMWRDWWEGYALSFHEVKERGADQVVRKRRMYAMRMAKKICEDWAALLLNEQTLIRLDNSKAQDWLCGKDNEGGVLDDIDFWSSANGLVEQAFATGAGAFVLRVDGLQVKGAGAVVQSGGTRLQVEYLPADCILPITVRHGVVQDVAFMSEIMLNGAKAVYLEIHKLEKDGYHITNEFFRQEDQGAFTPLPCPVGTAPEIRTGSAVPWFGIIRPNLVVNLPVTDRMPGLGMAVFANAIDQLKACDLAYNNFCKDFFLGGKKVFYDGSLIQYDAEGHAYTPDDIGQQLFVPLGDGNGIDARRDPIREYNPSLRVSENMNGIQAALDYLSFKCGLGTRHYRFDSGSGQVTATQYTGDRQDMRQHSNKHYITIKAGLKDIIRAILWAGKTFQGADIDPDCGIDVAFDDSYISDSVSERETDRQDVRDGLMADWEYRAKWYGEDAETAQRACAAMQRPSDDDLMGFGDGEE